MAGIDRTEIINRIILSRKEELKTLKDYYTLKALLEKMKDEELQAELMRSLQGSYKAPWDRGLSIEKNEQELIPFVKAEKPEKSEPFKEKNLPESYISARKKEANIEQNKNFVSPYSLNEKLSEKKEQSKSQKEIFAEQRALRESAGDYIALMYDNAINLVQQYQGENGIADFGFYRELAGESKTLTKIAVHAFLNPTVGGYISNRIDKGDVATNLADIIKQLEEDKQFAQNRLNTYLVVNDKAGFEKEFKALTGTDYNEDNMRKFVEMVQDKNADFEDEKFVEDLWNTYNKAFGEKKADKNGNTYYECGVIKRINDKIASTSRIDNVGDVVFMLLATGGLGALVKAGGKKGTKKFLKYAAKKGGTTKAVTKVALKTGKRKFLGTTVGILTGNMAESAITWTTWNATQGYLDILTKANRYTGEAAEAEMAAYRKGNLESAKFGMFAGFFNATATTKIMKGLVKLFDKPTSKITTGKIAGMLSKSGSTGTEIMEKFMLNSKGFTLAELISTIPEVGGFTLYETVNEIAEELMVVDKNGERHLPDELTEDGFVSYAWEKLKSQAYGLGEIKAISKILFMHKSGKVEFKKSVNENLVKCETLKKIRIQEREMNCQKIYEITMPDGQVEYANSIDEVIANCYMIMQMDIIANSIRETMAAAQTGQNDTEQTQPQATATNPVASGPIFQNPTDKMKTAPDNTTQKNKNVNGKEETVETVSQKICPGI